VVVEPPTGTPPEVGYCQAVLARRAQALGHLDRARVRAVLLFLGDSILAFVADQLRKRRAYRLALERERTKQARIAHDRDTLTWQECELEHATSSEQAPEPR
jgi:hypothetical protein